MTAFIQGVFGMQTRFEVFLLGLVFVLPFDSLAATPFPEQTCRMSPLPPVDEWKSNGLTGEASLSVHVSGADFDLSGSYETGFMENDSNQEQWSLPNVIAVIAK